MNHFHLDFSRARQPRGQRLAQLGEVRRSGVLLAIPDAPVREEMLVALDAAGIEAAAVTTCQEVLAIIERAPTVGSLPEVFVVDVHLLNSAREHVIETLEEAGCLESLLVILSGLWPRGFFPAWLEPLNCLHDPVPMPVFVEEVARLATPASMRTPRVCTA